MVYTKAFGYLGAFTSLLGFCLADMRRRGLVGDMSDQKLTAIGETVLGKVCMLFFFIFFLPFLFSPFHLIRSFWDLDGHLERVICFISGYSCLPLDTMRLDGKVCFTGFSLLRIFKSLGADAWGRLEYRTDSMIRLLDRTTGKLPQQRY